VAQLAVPTIADWCAVEMAGSDGFPERLLLVVHTNAEKVELAREYCRRFPLGRHDARGVTQVIRTGRSELYSSITDEMLDAAFSDRAQREMLRAIAPRSAMIVPMAAHGRTLGALVLASAESKRSFTGEDLALAEELGGTPAWPSSTQTCTARPVKPTDARTSSLPSSGTSSEIHFRPFSPRFSSSSCAERRLSRLNASSSSGR